jgi:hypothetical protein
MVNKINSIPDLFIGFEVDLYMLFSNDILGKANSESKYLEEIIDRIIIENKNLHVIKKRGFLNKKESFLCDGLNLFGLSVDNQSLEYNSLPFCLSYDSINSIIFWIYSDLSKIARLLNNTGINPFEVFLPISLPRTNSDTISRNRHKSKFSRLSGLHINLSSSGEEGLSEFKKKLYIRLIPLLNICHARALINGVRSPRSALLSIKEDINLAQSETNVPFEIVNRWRGNGVQLSIPSAEWPIFFQNLKSFFT